MFGFHKQILTELANWVCRRPALAVSVALIVAVGSALFTIRNLDFRTSRNDLIGKDSEYWRLFSAYAQEFRSEEDFVIVVESGQPSRNREAVDALQAALLAPENNPHRKDSVMAQQFGPADVFARVHYEGIEPWYLYYLTKEELEQVRDSLKEFRQLVAVLAQTPTLATFFEAMTQMVQQMELASPDERARMAEFLPTVTAILKQMVSAHDGRDGPALLSPWASAFFSEEMLREAEQQMVWNGYHAFANGNIFVVLVHPREETPHDAPAAHAATIKKLRRIIGEVQPSYPDVTMRLTGELVLDHDEMESSQRDAQWATVVTLLLCGLLFVFGFREWLRPILALVCLVMVVAMSLGFATLWPGYLNIITITFAVMIIGLGIDLTIQFIARYEEDLSRGMMRMQAVRTAISQTGPSIITAAMTNAAAFFAMTLSGFRGTVELGVIAGAGLLIAALVTMLVLPPLLLLVHRSRESTHIPARAVATTIERGLLRHPYRVLTVCLLATAVSLTAFWRVRFDHNVLNLQSKGLESVDAELRLLTSDAQSTIFAAVVADNFEQARALESRLVKLPTVSSVVSIVPIIPEHQAEKRDVVRAIKAELAGVTLPSPGDTTMNLDGLLRVLNVLRLRCNSAIAKLTADEDAASRTALMKLSETITDVRSKLQDGDPETTTKRLSAYERKFYADLNTQLKMMANQQTERELTVDGVPDEMRRMLVGKTGKLLLRVFPKENIWERPALEAFVADLKRVDPNATGTPLGLYEFVGLLQRGYRDAALWAFGVIALLIFADFRSWRATVLTLIPLVAGVTWMLGLMALPRWAADRLEQFGWLELARTVGKWEIMFNPANIMVLPLIVGIGVAYGIYVVQRFRENRDPVLYSKSTGRAVVLSGLTTLVAFGSLIGGSHLGIRSLGLVMVIGVTACLVSSLVMLPALLELARRHNWEV